MTVESKQQSDIRRTVKKLALIVVGMCFFVAALVPLYDLFCEVTGLNGKPAVHMYLMKLKPVPTQHA